MRDTLWFMRADTLDGLPNFSKVNRPSLKLGFLIPNFDNLYLILAPALLIFPVFILERASEDRYFAGLFFFILSETSG